MMGMQIMGCFMRIVTGLALILFSLFVIIIIVAFIVYPRTPEYFPGEQKGDTECIWICEEPFIYLYQKQQDLLEGEIFYDNEEVDIYMYEVLKSAHPYWMEIINQDGESKFIDSDGLFYRDYFELEVKEDETNLFDGEFPTLRFEKMTKEEFAKKYPSIDLEEPGRTG